MSILVNAQTGVITTGNLKASFAMLLAILAGAPAAAQDAAVDLADPVTLFNKVCLGDEVKLPKSQFAPIAYAKVPAGVKTVLGYSLPPQPTPAFVMLTPMPSSEVPNQILAVLPKKKAYLMLPAHGANGRTASQCAVIWRGNHYDEAMAAAQAISALKRLSPAFWSRGKGIPGAKMMSVQSEGLIVGTAEFSGWTVIRLAPDLSPQEQIVQ
jgi:hypothetical protein